MTKIEPMTVGEIKEAIRWHRGKDEPSYWCQTCRLYLAWIHAEARARYYKEPGEMSFSDRLAAVKAEIGWPEEKL